MLKAGDELREAPGYLDGWDYNTELNLTRELQVDLNAIRQQASLPVDLLLSLSVTAFSTSTWVRKRVFLQVLTSEVEDVTVDIALMGDDLGGQPSPDYLGRVGHLGRTERTVRRSSPG